MRQGRLSPHQSLAIADITLVASVDLWPLQLVHEFEAQLPCSRGAQEGERIFAAG